MPAEKIPGGRLAIEREPAGVAQLAAAGSSLDRHEIAARPATSASDQRPRKHPCRDRSSNANSLQGQNSAGSLEICANLSKGYFATTFLSSSPLCPANQSGLSGLCPRGKNTRNISESYRHTVEASPCVDRVVRATVVVTKHLRADPLAQSGLRTEVFSVCAAQPHSMCESIQASLSGAISEPHRSWPGATALSAACAPVPRSLSSCARRSAPRSACDTTAPARCLSGTLGSATPTGSAHVVRARCRPWPGPSLGFSSRSRRAIP